MAWLWTHYDISWRLMPCWESILSIRNLILRSPQLEHHVLFYTDPFIQDCTIVPACGVQCYCRSPLHLFNLSKVVTFPSYLTILPDHDVVTVPIPNSQNISSYTVACTRQCELLDGLIQFIPVGKKDTISLCFLLHPMQCTVQIGQSPMTSTR